MGTKKHRKSGEVTFEPVYSADGRKRILGAFKAKRGFKPDQFFHELECHAIYYNYLSAALKKQPEVAPSVLIRRWSGLATKLQVAKKALAEARTASAIMVADFRRLADIYEAAQDCARREGGMPGFEPTRFEVPPLAEQSDSVERDEVLVWPTNEKVEQVMGDLDWLYRVVQRAQERETWVRTTRERFNPNALPGRHRPGGKAAGRRSDDVRHRFVAAIDALYRANALDPKNPRTADRGRDDTKVGELIDLLDTCLGPLGINLDPNALYRLWRSATGRA